MTVPVVTDMNEARYRVLEWRKAGRKVGVVPTMGALHEGHLSLVRASADQCDATVVTIFVNPTQFGPDEDFDKYPRTLEDDVAQLESLGVDYVFNPTNDAMYPERATTSVVPPAVAAPLEGAKRPGHFAGVCTIVLKLFQIIPADIAFFGQKDYQQSLVVRRMVEDLNLSTEIQVCPIVREQDGLALSSRNRYLDQPERERALGLSRALDYAERQMDVGETNAAEIMAGMRRTLEEHGVDQIDYAVLADPESLELLIETQRPLVALIAAHVGSTRLIDNRIIE